MPTVEHFKSLTLDLPPSCVEFWPSSTEFAVVGTYNLEKSTSNEGSDQLYEHTEVSSKRINQQRNGSLILLQVLSDGANIIQALPTPSAILDVHFTTASHSSTHFGVATSTGSIGIYQLNYPNDDSKVTPEMSYIKTIQYFPEDILITAFSWHPRGTSIGMALSTGEIFLGKYDPDLDSKLLPSRSVGTHELEAWTLSFLPDGSGLFSGGDDSALNFFELPINQYELFNAGTELQYTEIRRIPWTDRKIHGAGVVAILPLETNEQGILILTGSYDDHIRLIQAPTVGRRTVLAELNLGGGVWRLKRLNTPTMNTSSEGKDYGDVLLLASCMHAGARILKLAKREDGVWYFEVLAKFEEHKSMNYGSDCQPDINSRGQRTFITTSFYDRLLCLWRY